MASPEKPSKDKKKAKLTISERRRQARKKRKLKEKKRQEKYRQLRQGFSSRPSKALEDKCDGSYESHELREPIVLEKRERGVRKVIPDKKCDECGGSPGKGKSLTVYYKTNVGEVAICDCCLDNVKERSGRSADAFRGAFLGGGFSPR